MTKEEYEIVIELYNLKALVSVSLSISNDLLYIYTKDNEKEKTIAFCQGKVQAYSSVIDTIQKRIDELKGGYNG